MFSYLPLIFRNGVRNRRRSILTVLSIAASFCMLGVLMAMYTLFFLTPATPDQALRLITRNRISFTNTMPMAYEQRIRRIPGVREVMVYDFFGGTYKDSRDAKNTFARFAVEPSKLFIIHPEYSLPESQKEEFIKRRDACIIGRPLAERLGLKIGDRVALIGDIFRTDLDLLLVGIYDSEIDNQALFFSYDYLNESFHGRLDQAIMFMLMADNAASVGPVAHAIDDMFRNAPVQTKTETEKGMQLSFLSYIGNVQLFLIAVCASLTGTVLLVSANTMAMSVRERVAEVGILKTLGFTPDVILGMIVGESMLIAMCGGVFGFAIAQAVIGVLRRLPVLFVNLTHLSISPGVALMGVLLAALVGLLSSALPAWGASRRGIIECLRLAD
ncbi:MAG TPA: FtsX-like permease family protein [Bryobacteraceae bacterium]|nr:FtsX-like permease family protein [Bryobacteraceae bacterium]